MAFLLTNLLRISWGFPSVRIRCLQGFFKKPPPCQPHPPSLCSSLLSFDSCVTQVLLLCLFMPSRFWSRQFGEVIPTQIRDGVRILFYCLLSKNHQVWATPGDFFFNDLIWSWIERGLRKTTPFSLKAKGPGGWLVQSRRVTRFFCSFLCFLWVSIIFEPSGSSSKVKSLRK